MKRRFLPFLAAGLIAIGMLAGRFFDQPGPQTGLAAAATTRTTANQGTTSTISTSSIDAATEGAYSTISRSVVYIVSQGIGSGSGIIYDTNGDIVTNNHVITGASALTVTLKDGRTYSATVVGTDPADDLAVIRIHASNLTPAHFAAAGNYQVAQTVLAVGSPLGLKQSVSSGLISGLHRVEQEQNGAYLSDAIQTSAAINPGNSGGALVTLDGRVAGIPTLVQTSSTSGTAVQDIGFAIPSERVTAIADQLIATGKVQHTGRPYLGISPSDASSQSASPFGAQQGGTAAVSGALVSQVAANGPAAQAGIQQGDVITAANGLTVTDAQDLLTVLAQEKPGNTMTLKIDRSGQITTVQVHLGELPA